RGRHIGNLGAALADDRRKIWNARDRRERVADGDELLALGVEAAWVEDEVLADEGPAAGRWREDAVLRSDRRCGCGDGAAGSDELCIGRFRRWNVCETLEGGRWRAGDDERGLRIDHRSEGRAVRVVEEEMLDVVAGTRAEVVVLCEHHWFGR